MKIMSANRIGPDGTLRFAASHLGLFCMPMSHKKDVRLIWINCQALQLTTCVCSTVLSMLSGLQTGSLGHNTLDTT